MSPSSDGGAGDPQSPAASDHPGHADQNEPTTAPAQTEPKTEPTTDLKTEPTTEPATEPKDPPAPTSPPPPGFLAYTLLALFVVGFTVWLIFAWTGYKHKYSQVAEGWHLGGTKMIEITLVRADKKNLACASDKSFGALHCGYRRNGQPTATNQEHDPTVLQPFNTVKNELFLAAGLWQSPVLYGTLPPERFTVVCNYHVVGVLKSAALRWAVNGSFNPLDQSVAVGSLSDCVIPQ